MLQQCPISPIPVGDWQYSKSGTSVALSCMFQPDQWEKMLQALMRPEIKNLNLTVKVSSKNVRIYYSLILELI